MEEEITTETDNEVAGQLINQVRNLVARIRKIVIICRKASLVREHVADWALEQALPFNSLIIDFRIRWNTVYLMLDRIIKFQGILKELVANPEKIEVKSIFYLLTLFSPVKTLKILSLKKKFFNYKTFFIIRFVCCHKFQIN